MPKLISNSNFEILAENGAKLDIPGFDPKPVVRFFDPQGGPGFFLVAAAFSSDFDQIFFFGIHNQLGFGDPRLCYFNSGMVVSCNAEVDNNFVPKLTIKEYAEYFRDSGIFEFIPEADPKK